MTWIRVTMALAVVATTAGCAGGSSGSYSVAAQRTLTADLRRVDAAEVQHDTAALRTALAHLTTDALAARAAGRISQSRADAILTASARLNPAQSSPAAIVAPSPRPSPAALRSPTPQPKVEHTKPGKGKGHGKGKHG